MLELEYSIHDKVQQEVDRSQREFFLREQMRAIQIRAGRDRRPDRRGPGAGGAARLSRDARGGAGQGPEGAGPLEGHAAWLRPEVGIIRTYLDWLLELPWTEATDDNLDIAQVAKALGCQPLWPAQGQGAHPGVPGRAQAVGGQAIHAQPHPLLCRAAGHGQDLAGPLHRRGAWARKFVRVSLGGIRDEAEIRGHRRTYIGALPGRIIQTMRTAGTVNPLFMLDEIDKVGARFPRRSLGRPAGGAGSRAEQCLLGPLPGRALRPVQGDVHHHRQHPGSRSRRRCATGWR